MGHEFVVRGVVSDSEDDGLVQIPEDQIVLDANGKAANWFSEHKGQGFLSDEFDFLRGYSQAPGGFFSCGDEVTVGHVYALNGQEIEPEDLEPGQVVQIQGKIRESMYWQSTGKSGYCTDEELAVYETIRVVQEPLQQ